MQSARCDRLVVADFIHRFGGTAGNKGSLSGQAFVQDRAQGVDVGGRSDAVLLSGCLLGCHVARGADRLAGSCGIALELLIEDLGEAEVGDFGNIPLGKKDIGRFRSRCTIWCS